MRGRVAHTPSPLLFRSVLQCGGHPGRSGTPARASGVDLFEPVVDCFFWSRYPFYRGPRVTCSRSPSTLLLIGTLGTILLAWTGSCGVEVLANRWCLPSSRGPLCQNSRGRSFLQAISRPGLRWGFSSTRLGPASFRCSRQLPCFFCFFRLHRPAPAGAWPLLLPAVGSLVGKVVAGRLLHTRSLLARWLSSASVREGFWLGG